MNVFGRHLAAGVVVAGTGLIGVPPAPPQEVQHHPIALTGVDTADSPLGGGTALVLGPSGFPIPTQGYLDAVENLYLAPRGFTGTVQGLATPEALYPVTGVKSLPFDTSAAQGQQILYDAITKQIDAGHVDAANPVVVFGYSQSSVISAQLMQELADHGVPSDDVHFVLVADESVPNGGSLSSFDIPVGTHPSAPALGITFSGAQPSDLYPTDVYTQEYDGFADFPRYPAFDGPAVLNALIGILTQHLSYADLSPEQIADAIQLPTSAADSLTNYYVIPDEYLPLLQPLLWVGLKPLYDLLEPDMRILVDLGYGSLTEGWNQGPADVATPVGFLPPDIDLGQLFTALVNGAQQGFTDFLHDLQNPADNQTAAMEALQPLVSALHTFGVTDATSPAELLANPHTLLEAAGNLLSNFANYPIVDPATLDTPAGIINDLTATIAGDYATLLPIADTANALLTSLPAVALDILTEQIQAGDPLGGIEDLIGAGAGIIPFALYYGTVIPLAEALGGTLVNLAELFPGS